MVDYKNYSTSLMLIRNEFMLDALVAGPLVILNCHLLHSFLFQSQEIFERGRESKKETGNITFGCKRRLFIRWDHCFSFCFALHSLPVRSN